MVWGFNGFGALGLGLGKSIISGAATNIVKRPKRLHGPWSLVGQSVASVACGPAHSAVLSSGGLLFTCGQTEGDGRLGVEAAAWSGEHVLPILHQVVTRDPWTDPAGREGPLVTFAQAACGHHHTLALSTAGAVYSTGRNRYGQLASRRSHGRHWMDRILPGDIQVRSGRTKVYI